MEVDLPGTVKSQKMTYQGLTNPSGLGKSSSVIWWRWEVFLLNLKTGFDETSWLKSSSGDKLVVSRNCPDSDKSSSEE